MSGGELSPVLIAGGWRESKTPTSRFQARNPQSQELLPREFPVSGWADLEAALTSAGEAAPALRKLPAVVIADFLEKYASGLEARAEDLAATAHLETALPVTPRLKGVELPRTTGQLRQAATAVREGSWQRPTIDTAAGLRSCLAPIGPVWVIGPNNFPFAFNGIAGGDFAAAIAAGNPVLAKAHPLHPNTSKLLAEAAHEAAVTAGLPPGSVQMVYHVEPADGLRLIADSRLKAIAFTGSRAAGFKLKAAADAAGKPFFGEMSSLNPVVMLPGALAERGAELAEQLATSVLMGVGQFCTKPGLILTVAGNATEKLISEVTARLEAAPSGTLFSEAGKSSLLASISQLTGAGAQLLTGGVSASAASMKNCVLRATGDQFLNDPAALQHEAFGNAVMFVVAASLEQLAAVINTFEGNLTGSIYSSVGGVDEGDYGRIEPLLRPKVGRLLNDKMPTGVAVSAAMNHGGPFPATSQPHFSAVGMPGAIGRFTQLESYDNVREPRLPSCLRDKNPTGSQWRLINGAWSQADV